MEDLELQVSGFSAEGGFGLSLGVCPLCGPGDALFHAMLQLQPRRSFLYLFMLEWFYNVDLTKPSHA